jgi:hypothetical protein
MPKQIPELRGARLPSAPMRCRRAAERSLVARLAPPAVCEPQASQCCSRSRNDVDHAQRSRNALAADHRNHRAQQFVHPRAVLELFGEKAYRAARTRASFRTPRECRRADMGSNYPAAPIPGCFADVCERKGVANASVWMYMNRKEIANRFKFHLRESCEDLQFGYCSLA